MNWQQAIYFATEREIKTWHEYFPAYTKLNFKPNSFIKYGFSVIAYKKNVEKVFPVWNISFRFCFPYTWDRLMLH